MTKKDILNKNELNLLTNAQDLGWEENDYIDCNYRAMDEFAEQQAIAFLNWTWENGWVRCYYDGAYHGYYNSKLFTDGNIEEITTEQLYKLFIDTLK